ncbi:ABC transporter permease [Nocardia aurantia]|uniref:Autoinducer 2 import system permease protein LsrD n=1 Tax=Nocardia aurantia TaxID=2585199 RepID=A0A7K0E122_9NOCA|nr:ABC transporter permease [Nocardia aurantia]MQY31571.1 Autoinducer 2 import system permease protein LsrD [Nocardia aurantia]
MTETKTLSAQPDSPRTPRRRLLPAVGLDRFSGLYLLVVLVIAYSLIEPSTFFTSQNFRLVLSSQAITGIITLGLMVSLICGVFDLSIAANMTWAVLFVGYLQEHGYPWGAAVVLAVLSGAVIGVLNAIVVTRLHVDSVIGTLGMSSILAAVSYRLTGGQAVTTGIRPGFSDFGNAEFASIPLPVYFFAVIAVALWYFLNYRPSGRYLYAVGSNLAAARLAGLKVLRLQWTGLIVSATVASFAGVVFAAQLGNSPYNAGTSYLLPAFSAAFLGATQVRPGRFNVWGTVIAIYLLAVGVKGLKLKWPSEAWISDLFEGVVLIVAVALAVRSSRRTRTA